MTNELRKTIRLRQIGKRRIKYIYIYKETVNFCVEVRY